MNVAFVDGHAVWMKYNTVPSYLIHGGNPVDFAFWGKKGDDTWQ